MNDVVEHGKESSFNLKRFEDGVQKVEFSNGIYKVNSLKLIFYRGILKKI